MNTIFVTSNINLNKAGYRFSTGGTSIRFPWCASSFIAIAMKAMTTGYSSSNNRIIMNRNELLHTDGAVFRNNVYAWMRNCFFFDWWHLCNYPFGCINSNSRKTITMEPCRGCQVHGRGGARWTFPAQGRYRPQGRGIRNETRWIILIPPWKNSAIRIGGRSRLIRGTRWKRQRCRWYGPWYIPLKAVMGSMVPSVDSYRRSWPWSLARWCWWFSQWQGVGGVSTSIWWSCC